MASKDTRLDEILARIKSIDEILSSKKVTLETFNCAITPAIRTSNLMEYDSDTGLVKANVAYEIIAPFVKHMSASESNIKQGYGFISFIKDGVMEMTNLNAQGASARDSMQSGCFSGKQIVGIDVVCGFAPKIKPDVSLKTDSDDRLKRLERIVCNFHNYSADVKGTSIFFSVDRALSEGYLMVINEAEDSDLGVEKILGASLSDSKTANPLLTRNLRKVLLYAIANRGQIKKRVLGEDEGLISRWLSEIQNSIFGLENQPLVKSYSVFLNGRPVDPKDFFMDLKDSIRASCVSYLNMAKPRVRNGNVEYNTPFGLVSEEKSAFLKKISVLFDGGVNEARRAISLDEEPSGMYG